MPMRGNGMVILQTQQKLFAEPFNSGRSSAKCIFTAKYTFEKIVLPRLLLSNLRPTKVRSISIGSFFHVGYEKRPGRFLGSCSDIRFLKKP